VLEEILEHVAGFVASLPEELAGEVADAGVCLCGGGALLGGMAERLVGELKLAVWRAPDPLLAVVDGARALSRAGRVPALAAR